MGTIQSSLLENMILANFSLTETQVSREDYVQWLFMTNALFALGTTYNKSKERDTDALKEQVYAGMRACLRLVGDVNEYSLIISGHNMDSLIGVLASLAFESAVKDEQGKRSAQQWFRHFFEEYVTYQIVNQLSKDKETLEEEREERRVKRREATRRREKARRERERQEKLQREKVSEKNSAIIEFVTVVVVGNAFKCCKNHNVHSVQATFNIVESDGKVVSRVVSAGFCQECDVYFLLEADYKELRAAGVLLCQIITEAYYNSEGTQGFDESNLLPESRLHQYGYNVNSSDNLTEKQRQHILKLALDNNVYSKLALMSFFDWLIERNERITHKNMSAPLEKWRADRSFVANYVEKNTETVAVNRVILR